MQDTSEAQFNSWVGKIPCSRKWHPSPVFLPGQSHGQGSLVGYSPQTRKKSDRTEPAGTHANPAQCALSKMSQLQGGCNQLLEGLWASIFWMFVSLQSLIFSCYWQPLWPHLRMCARSCVEKCGEAESREDKSAEMILKDACFPNYLSLPGFVNIKRGIIF